ncbi:MAG: GDSL-type esterase/lipase family protein [Prosthecobacter sp.]
MNRSSILRLFAVVFLTLPVALHAEAKKAKAPDVWPKSKPTTHDYKKWEKNIAAFETADKESQPAKGSILFIGSSTIVRWKTLAEDFAGVPVLNRGFGGNQIKDSTFYAERMIFPYAPKAIFLRAGGNDINAGWPAEDVFNDFKIFVANMRERLPNIPIYYIGLSPTVKRLKQVDEGNKLNDLIASWAKEQTGITYIDTRALSLDKDGKVRPELFVEDMLHFNPEGYKLLSAALKPFVTAAAAAK